MTCKLAERRIIAKKNRIALGGRAGRTYIERCFLTRMNLPWETAYDMLTSQSMGQ